MAMAVEVARTNISEFDKTVSMLENMTDEEKLKQRGLKRKL